MRIFSCLTHLLKNLLTKISRTHLQRIVLCSSPSFLEMTFLNMFWCYFKSKNMYAKLNFSIWQIDSPFQILFAPFIPYNINILEHAHLFYYLWHLLCLYSVSEHEASKQLFLVVYFLYDVKWFSPSKQLCVRLSKKLWTIPYKAQ